MQQFGGKDSKRHFTVVMGSKEHGLYVSSTPSSAAKKAVTKLCAANKSKKVEFSIREITQGSKKKTYGPYKGHIEKLKEPIKLKGRVIKYKPVAKLSGKLSAKKGGMFKNPAGPALENNKKSSTDPTSENDYNQSRKYEQIAYIILTTPDIGFQNDEYSEKIKKLEQIGNDIFKVDINYQNKNIFEDIPKKTNIFITLNGLSISEAKKKLNFNKKLNDLIEILKYLKKNEFTLYNSNKEQFSPEHNEFLTYLHQELEKE